MSGGERDNRNVTCRNASTFWLTSWLRTEETKITCLPVWVMCLIAATINNFSITAECSLSASSSAVPNGCRRNKPSK